MDIRGILHIDLRKVMPVSMGRLWGLVSHELGLVECRLLEQ